MIKRPACYFFPLKILISNFFFIKKYVFFCTRCRKTHAKSLVFSYIRVKKITVYTDILTWKVNLHIFSLLTKKDCYIKRCWHCLLETCLFQEYSTITPATKYNDSFLLSWHLKRTDTSSKNARLAGFPKNKVHTHYK